MPAARNEVPRVVIPASSEVRISVSLPAALFPSLTGLEQVLTARQREPPDDAGQDLVRQFTADHGFGARQQPVREDGHG